MRPPLTQRLNELEYATRAPDKPREDSRELRDVQIKTREHEREVRALAHDVAALRAEITSFGDSLVSLLADEG